MNILFKSKPSGESDHGFINWKLVNLSWPSAPPRGFLEVSASWKYFIKFSNLVWLNCISIHDGWNSLYLYQYMSWSGAGRTRMSIWIQIRVLIFCFVLPQCASVRTHLFSIDNASGIKRFKTSISRLLFSITVIGPVNSAIWMGLRWSLHLTMSAFSSSSDGKFYVRVHKIIPFLIFIILVLVIISRI